MWLPVALAREEEAMLVPLLLTPPAPAPAPAVVAEVTLVLEGKPSSAKLPTLCSPITYLRMSLRTDDAYEFASCLADGIALFQDVLRGLYADR